MIQNVKCSKHESKQRRDNTKAIKIKFLNNDQMNKEIIMSELNANYDNISEECPLPPIKPITGMDNDTVADIYNNEYMI